MRIPAQITRGEGDEKEVVDLQMGDCPYCGKEMALHREGHIYIECSNPDCPVLPHSSNVYPDIETAAAASMQRAVITDSEAADDSEEADSD